MIVFYLQTLQAQTPSYTLEPYSPDVRTEIILNREHENYELFEISSSHFCSFLSNIADTVIEFNLICGENEFLLTLSVESDTNFVADCSPYRYSGIANNSSSSYVELWVLDSIVYLIIEDSTVCINLAPLPESLLLPNVHLFESIIGVNSDPELDPPVISADPVNCNLNIETFIHTDQAFVDYLGGITKVEDYVHMMLKGINGVEKYYTKEIQGHGGSGRLIIDYVLQHSNGMPKIIIHPNPINVLQAKEFLGEYTIKNYPCFAKDLQLYLTGPLRNSLTNGLSGITPPCTNAGLGTSKAINISYSENLIRLGYTVKHEFGHYFDAGHLSNDPNNSCYCEISQKYLMCDMAPGDLMHPCSWELISEYMNTHCECFSDSHNDPCGHCTFEGGVLSSVSPVYNETCKDASEFIVTAYLHNDCTPKTYQNLKLSYSKGNVSSSRDKIVVLDPLDFDDGIETSHPDLNFIVANGPFSLGPEERLELKCKMKLVEIGSNSGQPNIAINIYTNQIVVANGSIPMLNPNSAPSKLHITTTETTISGLISAGKQFDLTSCTNLQRNLRISRDITINTDHLFTNNHIYIDDAKKITIAANKTLTICNSNINSCEDFWNSITLESGANLIIDNSKINDAEYLAKIKGSNDVQIINNSKIDHCNHGVYNHETSSGDDEILIEDSEFCNITESVCNINGAENFTATNSSLKTIGSSGFVLQNTASTIKGCLFENIGNGYRGTKIVVSPFTGNGIYHEGEATHSLTTIQDSDPHAPKNKFEDVNCGIIVNGSSYNLQGNMVQNAEFGIHVYNAALTSSNVIASNEIQANYIGVNLSQNAGMTATIRDNIINCLSTYGTALEIDGNGGNITVMDNTVTNETGNAGIKVNLSSNVTVKNNTVFTNSTNGTRTDGIYLVGSSACNVTCNNISCVSFEHSTSAIEIQESPANTVSCNEMQGAWCGLVFAGSCNPNIVGENKLSDHGLGLVLVTRATGGDGIIGPQTHMGNNITGCGTDKDAVNYGLPNVLLQSPFLVSPSAPYLPNNIQELVTQGWFSIPQQGQEYSCTANNVCPDGIGARSSDKEDYTLNMSLLNKSIGMDVFDDARTWSARKNILQYIKTQIIETKDAKQWLKVFANTSLDLYSDIGVFCNNFLPVSNKLNNLLQQKKFNRDQSGSDLKLLKKLIKEEVANLNIEKKIRINAFMKALLGDNPLTLFEQNQKQISLIRLQHLLEPTPFKEDELQILKSIAYKCPYEEGNSVYEARMLLGSISPVIVNEADLCGLRPNNQSNSDRTVKNMIVYPNPSDNSLNIRLIGAKDNEVFNGRLLDLNGKIVKEFQIHYSYDLPIFALDPGMYLIYVDQNPQWTTKVFIQK